ncbi:sugar lactone lactonase YvrE [Sagittula marina]|uniref:Sugar lactone lactonase YvrE n=1 Tax=Sagittula marina TaxID=943940 RepID=A0A7W6GV72_9RHOB|nr:SMP-30/gluconolactonase/LRE family protein [Sagittula marina]MBB3987019.1 sugar lactone lactonase YvrE [Sagittula marina]
MSAVQTLSQTRCILGEGALWHPERGSFFWFDILGHKLFEHDGSAQREWSFDRAVSAAGWIDDGKLLVASEVDLFVFDLDTGAAEHIVPLEADQPANRSNDGRADPFGGFWIGTMGYACEQGAGAIYRYYRGELRKIVSDITITNAICFAPDGRSACFGDTPKQTIWRVALDDEGWPVGDREVFVDMSAEPGVQPDGAVIDTAGRLWTAQWGMSRVACYGTDGTLDHVVPMPARQVSCPSFGGPDRRRLFVTSASEGLPEGQAGGQTYYVDLDGVQGQKEHRVVL